MGVQRLQITQRMKSGSHCRIQQYMAPNNPRNSVPARKAPQTPEVHGSTKGSDPTSLALPALAPPKRAVIGFTDKAVVKHLGV